MRDVLHLLPASQRISEEDCKPSSGGALLVIPCPTRAISVDQFLIQTIEPCADIIVSAAARRSILIGGGAPLVQKNRRPKILFQRLPKIFVLSSKFSDDVFLVIENCK